MRLTKKQIQTLELNDQITVLKKQNNLQKRQLSELRYKASKFEKLARGFHIDREEARSIALFLKDRLRWKDRKSTYRWLEHCEQDKTWLKGGAK